MLPCPSVLITNVKPKSQVWGVQCTIGLMKMENRGNYSCKTAAETLEWIKAIVDFLKPYHFFFHSNVVNFLKVPSYYYYYYHHAKPLSSQFLFLGSTLGICRPRLDSLLEVWACSTSPSNSFWNCSGFSYSFIFLFDELVNVCFKLLSFLFYTL